MLHSDMLTPYTVQLETTHRVSTTTYETQVFKYSEPKYTTDIFGNQTFTHMEKGQRVVHRPVTVSAYDNPIVDHDGSRWVEWLTQEHVPQADIDRATSKAGEHFSQYGGVIIPLDFPQKDLLKAYSPLLYVRYENHYQSLFAALYPAEYE